MKKKTSTFEACLREILNLVPAPVVAGGFAFPTI